MNKFIITNAETSIKINLAPASEAEEIIQNLKIILASPKFSVPLDRDFGLSTEITDKPINAAETLLVSEIYEAFEKYEPRAEIVNINFERDGDYGRLIPKVEVTIIDN